MSGADEFPDIVEGVFPSGQLHLISGSRGAGKSSIEIWMEKAALSGQTFLGRQTWRPPFWGVLVFDRSSKDRLDSWAKIGMAPLPYYCLTDDPSLTPEKLLTQNPRESLQMLELAIDELEPPPGGVITIDVANFFAGDANLSYRSGFAHGWAVAKMAAQRQLTIFALMHGGKQRAGHQYLRLTDRTIASTGFMGTANAFAYIATEEETVHLADPKLLEFEGQKIQIMEWEPRTGPTERFYLGRLPSGLFTCLGSAALTVTKPEIGAAAQERMNAILNCFITTGCLELEGSIIRQELDMPKATFSRTINVLLDAGQVYEIRRSRKMFYRLKPAKTDS